MNLTDEQLNIAICEWRGWEEGYPKSGSGALHYREEKKWTKYHDPRPSHITGIEALGNMHAAEEELTAEQAKEFAGFLHLSIADEWAIYPATAFATIHATARQRAIALLRVVKPEICL